MALTDPARLPTRVWDRVGGRVGLLALFCAVSAVVLVVTTLWPPSPYVSTPLYAALAAYAALKAAVLLVAGRRVPRWVTTAITTQTIVLISVIAAVAGTPIGVVDAAFAYLPIGIYASYYARDRREAWGHAITVAVAFGVAVWVQRRFQLYSVWLLVSAATAAIIVVQQQLLERLRCAATVDPLTGMLNRAGAMATVDRLASRPRAASHSVVLIDLDGFKAVNDTHGHLEGDEVLASCAQVWRRHLRAGDVAARSGGDEFLLLLADTDIQEAHRVVSRLCDATPAPFSYGVAGWLPPEPFDRALARADLALYQHKSARRGHDVRVQESPAPHPWNRQP